MPSELERGLERALRRLPRPPHDVEQRARAAALDALPPAIARRANARRPLVAALAVLAVLLGAAAALAASGTVRISLRPSQTHALAATTLAVPDGATGIAAVLDDRLWLATRAGAHIDGFAAHTVALSPHARYVAVGIGRTLLVMSPAGRTAWAHRAGGSIRAIAWAPDGLRLAYVVARPRGFALRTIEGDGDHDRLLDAAVRPVRPSWRADSLAVAYVSRGGRAVVYNWTRGLRVVVTSGCAAGSRAVAFAPRGPLLAATTDDGLVLVDGGRAYCSDVARAAVGIGWLGRRIVVGSGSSIHLFAVRAGRLVASGRLSVRGRLRALTTDGTAVLYATRVDGALHVVAGRADVLNGFDHGRVSALDVR